MYGIELETTKLYFIINLDPVFFATRCGYESYRIPHYSAIHDGNKGLIEQESMTFVNKPKDGRCRSLQDALWFAKHCNLLGIMVEGTIFQNDLKLKLLIQESGLIPIFYNERIKGEYNIVVDKMEK